MPVTEIPLLDELLQRYRAELGGDYDAYRNHCCRVVNFALPFCAGVADAPDKLALAAAFHDLGIWTHKTFDYLAPSAALAREELAARGRAAWYAEIGPMIEQHHKIRPYRDDALAEAFRKADWIDVSLGALSFGLARAQRRAVLDAFPNAGFHKRLVALAWARLRSHPLSPMPMMRW